MLIWLNLLIPVLSFIVLYLLFKHKTLWWEFLIPFASSFLVIAICYFIAFRYATYAEEYWGNYFIQGEYYESWDEEVEYEVDVDDGEDEDGNRKSHTETRTRIDEHGPEWRGILNSDEVIYIDEDYYKSLKAQWVNEQFVELNRDYHSKDGDMYKTVIKSEQDVNIFTYFSKHAYVNKIQASSSVYKFKPVDPKEFGLYEHPPVQDNYCQSTLGEVKFKDKANRVLDVLNARYGQDKKMRLWVLFFKNKPMQAGVDQQSYWMGGHKNEFVVCVGLDNEENVQWCYPFSWSEKERLKIDIRDCAINMKPFDIYLFAWNVRDRMIADFQRKDFRDFNYIMVEPGTTAIIVTSIITLLVNIGVSFWIIFNQFDNEGSNYSNRDFLRRFDFGRAFRGYYR